MRFWRNSRRMPASGWPSSRSSASEIADLVVAIGDIDPDIAIEDLLALDAELARIGMDDDEPVALRQDSG